MLDIQEVYAKEMTNRCVEFSLARDRVQFVKVSNWPKRCYAVTGLNLAANEWEV